jgi:hypothetical protein
MPGLWCSVHWLVWLINTRTPLLKSGNNVAHQKVLFVYTFESKAGLSGKAKKITAGFEAAGCDVDTLYLGSQSGRLGKSLEMLSVYSQFFFKLFTHHYDVVYIRYAYYFFPLYVLAFLRRSNLQVEVNSNVTDELLARGQKKRAFIDSLVMAFVRQAAKRIHYSSKEMSVLMQKKYPRANFVFNTNFVVDESYTKKEHAHGAKVKLVFLGNTAQQWHGMPLFIKSLVCNNTWFAEACELHLVGYTSPEMQQIILNNDLQQVVTVHGSLFGEAKHKVLAEMDIGLSSFDLGFKRMKETSAIKTGEYLYSGLGLIIGYEDAVISGELPFVLNVNLQESQPLQQEKLKTFVEAYRDIPDVSQQAHDFAATYLMVDDYIQRILREAP